MGILQKFGFGGPKPENSSLPSGNPNYRERLIIGESMPTAEELAEAKTKGPEAVEALYELHRRANEKRRAAAGEAAVKETEDAISREIEGGSDTAH